MRLRPAATREDGFGLVEVVVAMGVVFTALILLAHTIVATVSDVGLARQRQGANTIASRTVELARSLPFETFAKGSETTDLMADSAVIDCSGTLRYLSCAGEDMVHTPGVPSVAPLVPHTAVESSPNGSTQYSVSTYVSEVANAPPSGAYRLIVVVTWDRILRGGTSSRVEVETIIFSPEGCVDAATHPFAAPCQPYFYASGSSQPGAITVSGTIDAAPVTATIVPPGARSDAQLEQVRHIQGTALATGMTLVSAARTQTLGSETAASGADDDPATTSPRYESVSLSGGTANLSEPFGLVTVTTSRGGSDQGESTSATAAGDPFGGGNQDCPTTGSSQTDGEACGHSWARQNGTSSVGLTLDALLPLTGPSLVQVAGPPAASEAVIDRTAGDDGLVDVTVTRSIGDVRIGALPIGLTAPVGWLGYWVRLTQYDDTVSAQVGDLTSPPAVTVGGGSIEYWNGAGYTTLALTSGAPVDLAVPPIDIDVSLGLLDVSLDISGAVRTGGTSVDDPEGPGSGITRHGAAATARSPLVLDMTYSLVIDDVLNLLDTTVALEVDVDLGSAQVGATYREGLDG